MGRAAVPPGQPGRNGHVPLDAVHANAAAAIHEQTQVSVADAHIGATLQSAPNADITVITSDPGDIRKVAGDLSVTVVAI
jgi:predicted nucleic acid-binding protein